MEWFALIIPAIAAVILLLFFYKKVTWGELFVPIGICFLFVIIFKFSAKTLALRDTEFWGSQIVEARYYESWNTWVTKTCSYTTTCCCDSKGNGCQTTTHYYDCSYCDRNAAYWQVIDNVGNSWRVTESYYYYLVKKWGAVPSFVELNRSIDFSHGCGKDGDMYSASWKYDGAETSESAVTEHSYINRVQASHSAFSLPTVSDKEAIKMNLYVYPEIYEQYKQKVVLGMDSLYDRFLVRSYEQYFQYLNGHYGASSKVKVFVCLFFDKPESIAYLQQAYWDGGNQNEIVVCIGIDKKTKNLKWVVPFSWTDNKRILVDLREDIMNVKKFNPISVYHILEKTISDKRVYKDLNKDFSYLTVELTFWQLFWIYAISIVLTCLTSYWAIANQTERNN